MSEKRLERPELAAARRTRRQLEAMPDAELAALATGCPAWAVTAIAGLSDTELDHLMDLPDAQLLPFLEGRRSG
jgi:hypothetical protein